MPTLNRQIALENISEIKQILQQEDLNINEPTDSGTPLEFAIFKGNAEIVALLLQHQQIDIHRLNTSNSTPLHDAVEQKNDAIVQLLMNNDKFDKTKENSIIYIIALIILEKYEEI